MTTNFQSADLTSSRIEKQFRSTTTYSPFWDSNPSPEDQNIPEHLHVEDFSSIEYLITEVSTHLILNSSSLSEKPEGKSTLVAVLICLLCGLVIVGTLFGNILVCLAVAITRKLRTPSNSLIVSLAFSDLLIAITVMPFALVLEVTGNWIFGQVICDVWTSLDVLLCTSSILNLCVISIDRYLVITRPFTYALKRTPTRMAIMITAVWVTSACISIPPQFGWRKPVKEGMCVISEEIGYQLFATVGAFYLPLLVMIIIYTRIYLVSSRLSKTVSYNRQPSVGSVGIPASPADAAPPFPDATPTFYEISKRRRQSSPCFERYNNNNNNMYEKRRKSSSILLFEKLHRSRSHQHKYVRNALPASTVSQPALTNHSALDSSAGSLTSNIKKARSRSVSQMLGKINSRLKLTPKSHKTNSDRKATRTLGIIMGSFIACWLPFFILALVKPFLGEIAGKIPRWLDTVFLWLGYANSLLNPIIYARFNRDFRVPFRYIIQCRCRSINNRMRVTEFAEQFGKSESSFNPNRDHPSGLQNTQQRHRLSNIRESQSTRMSINNRSGVATPEEQQFLQNNWKHSNDLRVTSSETFSGAANRARTLKGDNFKRPQPAQNLVFKRYNPQNKRNTSPMSCEVRKMEEKETTLPDESTTGLPDLANNRHDVSIGDARDKEIVEKEQLLFVQENKQQQQKTFNNSNNKISSSTTTTTSSNRNDHNHYQLFASKAPLINMNMVIDDDDDDDDDEEFDDDEHHSLKMAADDDDDDDEDDDCDDNEKSFNLELSGRSIMETRFPMHSLDSSSADVASNSSLQEYFKVKHHHQHHHHHHHHHHRQDGDRSTSSERNNGILKVFTTSFNEINKEHSFVI